MSERTKVLFITRTFPPSTGGMETVSYELHRNLKKGNDVTLVKWGGSKKGLPIALPYIFVRASIATVFKRPDVVYLADGVLSPFGLWFRYVLRIPVCMTVHGLDATFDNSFYQTIFRVCAKRINRIVCVSRATQDEVLARGVKKSQTVVIPNGINDEFHIAKRKDLRQMLSQRFDIDLDGKQILLSHGRLVRRKGVQWFAKNVIPKLTKDFPNVLYLVSGDGPYRSHIETTISKDELNKHVKLLGRTSDEELRALYNSADIFVMPNIKVPGDMEGFGVVLVEAASAGLPVIAADMEGMKDAIIDGRNGTLVEPENTDAYVQALSGLLSSNKRHHLGEKAREYTLQTFTWPKVARQYEKIFVILEK